MVIVPRPSESLHLLEPFGARLAGKWSQRRHQLAKHRDGRSRKLPIQPGAAIGRSRGCLSHPGMVDRRMTVASPIARTPEICQIDLQGRGSSGPRLQDTPDVIGSHWHCLIIGPAFLLAITKSAYAAQVSGVANAEIVDPVAIASVSALPEDDKGKTRPRCSPMPACHDLRSRGLEVTNGTDRSWHLLTPGGFSRSAIVAFE